MENTFNIVCFDSDLKSEKSERNTIKINPILVVTVLTN